MTLSNARVTLNVHRDLVGVGQGNEAIRLTKYESVSTWLGATNLLKNFFYSLAEKPQE